MIRGAWPLVLLVLAAAVPEPDGYHMEPYRGAVPDSIRGGTVIHTDALRALVARHGAVLIDVLPAPRRPAGLPAGRVWMPLPRRDIPGSVWLPDVGRGAIDAGLEMRFRDRLSQATGGHAERELVFYCLSMCWMSWNAAKRAIADGYTHVDWYPDGSDGWAAAGLPTEEARLRGQRPPKPRL